MSSDEQQWRIGRLAHVTGVTVRTLHHYDRIGLLKPSSRTSGGHRCYTGADVRRLHAILVLRGFGLGLTDIRHALAARGVDLHEVLLNQRDALDERIRRSVRLRSRLQSALDRLTDPTPSDLITLIEEMIAVETPLTPEQLAEMSRRRAELSASLTDEERETMTRRRQELMATLTPEQIEDMQRRRAAWHP
ncbi:MerR family transcriptional regulator [Actinoplanes sp. NPDC051861]|uniref:MerR family transcriptional regulator n=1 Tax=Actinoplanes sp. NPDC051861 TaxID=3155170 RepID=UPI00342977A7